MNPEDSQITAFLDDELDPGDRTAVAWAVEASPPSARHVAELQAGKDLVRDLDRPAIPVDLSASILAQIAPTARPPRRHPKLAVARFAAALVGVASVAASLLLAVILLHRALHDIPPAERVVREEATSPRNHPSERSVPPSSLSVVAPDSRLPDRSSTPARSPAEAGPAEAYRALVALAPAPSPAPAGPAPGAGEREPDRPEQVDAMLGNRKVLRALIVTDVLDRDAQRAQALIDRDPARLPGFGRITLAQGIVVDPDQPGPAEVYAVVVDRPGVESFVARLSAAFPRVTIEEEPEPALVTQLGEVGQAVLFPDEGAPRLGPAPANIRRQVATKAGTHPDDYLTGASPPGRPAEVPAESRIASKPADAKAKAEADDEPVTILVWVVRATRGSQ